MYISEYLKGHLVEFAKSHPSVQVVVEARWDRRPTVYAHYRTIKSNIFSFISLVVVEGKHVNASLANKSISEIKEIVQDLRNRSGSKPVPFHQSVASSTPAIRPIWSPFTMKPVGEADPFEGART